MNRLSDFGASTSKKIQKFLNTNAWVLTILLITFFVYVFLKFGDLTEKNEKVLETVKKDIGSVVFLTSDGQIIDIKKSPTNYKDLRIANYLLTQIADNLIYDLTSLSKGYTVTFASPNDLFKKTEGLKFFQKNFAADTYPYKLAKYYYQAIVNDELPEDIRIYSKKTEDYKVYRDKHGKTKFSLTGKYFIVTRQWLKEIPKENKWVSRKVIIPVKITGEFNVAKYGSLENPLGVKLSVESLPIPSKRGNK